MGTEELTPRGNPRVFAGMRRGTLEAIEPVSGRSRTLWRVRCDCGIEYVMQAGNFVRHASCKICRRLPPGEAALRDILRNYRSNNRHAEFSLTESQFRALLLANCNYCGSPPSNTKQKVSMGS